MERHENKAGQTQSSSTLEAQQPRAYSLEPRAYSLQHARAGSDLTKGRSTSREQQDGRSGLLGYEVVYSYT